MASAQVLPDPGAASARKQDHLEAGKRRLQEFRKNKKAAKKVTSTSHLPSVDAEVPDKSLNEHIGQPTSGRIIDNAANPSNLGAGTKKGIPSKPSDANFIDGIVNAAGNGNDRSGSSVSLVTGEDGQEMLVPHGLLELDNGSNIKQWDECNMPEGPEIDQALVEIQTDFDQRQTNQTAGAEVLKSESHSQGDANSNDLGNSVNYAKCLNPSVSSGSTDLFEGIKSLKEQVAGVSTDSSSSRMLFSKNDDSFMWSKTDPELHADNTRWKMRDSKFGPSIQESDSLLPEYLSVGVKGPTKKQIPPWIQGNATGRSRSSFLDSINVQHRSSVPDTPSDSMEVDPTILSGASYGGVQRSSTPQSSMKTDTTEASVSSHNDASNDLKVSLDKDGDFAALEQYIEDLTRQKFTLQRALDTSQSLAESLASENSSLTDSFNQQGKVVNQLRSDMERLQEEITAQLLALESLKLEYANIQLECHAADERAKILASEVINLEEKALRLRSNELKMEKQMENSNSEITSYKRKISSIEKEAKDLQMTVDALQEEKKVLQTMLRKASTTEAADRTNVLNKKDMCTSTDDLGDIHDIHNAEFGIVGNQVEDQGFTSTMTAGASASSTPNAAKSRVLSEAIVTIPHDHIRMIDNINALLSELVLEKEALMQALSFESSLSCKLKDLNKELSLKLETQTQKFELLASQQMASENGLLRPLNYGMTSEAMEYTDEGDEVVERVLGWIMKLFPGGPGKRRARRSL